MMDILSKLWYPGFCHRATFTLKMEDADFSEMLESTHNTIRYHNPKDKIWPIAGVKIPKLLYTAFN
jgi:hypothetical protein